MGNKEVLTREGQGLQRNPTGVSPDEFLKGGRGTRTYGSIPSVRIIFPHTLLLLFFSCLATRDGPKNIISRLDQQQVQEERLGSTQRPAPHARTQPGAGMGRESCARAAGSAEDYLGPGHRLEEVRCWTRQEGSGRPASPAGGGNLPQDEGSEEGRGCPLQNSLSCSGKRTSWDRREDDPSR